MHEQRKVSTQRCIWAQGSGTEPPMIAVILESNHELEMIAWSAMVEIHELNTDYLWRRDGIGSGWKEGEGGGGDNNVDSTLERKGKNRGSSKRNSV